MNGTVLIIEDDEIFAGGLKNKLEESSYGVEIKDFSDGLKEIENINPDVVVLDVFQGEVQNGNKSGMEISTYIWERMFVPLIFASAASFEIEKNLEEHPLIRRIQKTSTAFKDIVDLVTDLMPFGTGIKEIRAGLCYDAEQTTQKALTETTPHTLKGITTTPADECLALIKSTARRRLSVIMRQKSEEERSCLFAWEQYIYPPPDSSHFLTGDILVSSSGDRNKPEAFRVALSPSCDLANPRIDCVLVGKCVSIEEFCSKNGISPKESKKKEAQEKLKSMLTQAQSSGYQILPSYSNLIPVMALSLRNLELFKISNMTKAKSATGEDFERLASMDNPFREQLAWAYLQIAGRPGVPDRNLEIWIEEIWDHRQEKK
jgi:CheY-like chemotaxis protein